MKLTPSNRRSSLLTEMGLGPTWQLRDAQAALQVAAAVETAAVATALDAPAVPANAMSAASPLATVIPLVANPAPTVAEMDWDTLAATVAGCRLCGLCKGRDKTVFGVGDIRAKWLFVGEGPGYYENIQGEPFVGQAGRLLDNMLRALGVKRGEAAFIANIVKCRPTDADGKDRAPTPEEVAACLPYLQRQIELIQPQVIVALGKTAAVSLLGLSPDTAVGQLRGKIHRYRDMPLVATYHPAYLLRKPTDKGKTWADLCLAVNALSVPA